MLASSANAELRFDALGILDADSVKKFDGMRQHGVSLSFGLQSKSGKFWIPDSLDVTGGWLKRGPDSAAFVSMGPTYRFNLGRMNSGRLFLDIGAHPTYVSHTHFDGKPLGGKFFFTTYLGLGAFMDRQQRFSAMIRYQHTSNAGLRHDNPGVDMLGLTVSYHFGRSQQLFSATDSGQK